MVLFLADEFQVQKNETQIRLSVKCLGVPQKNFKIVTLNFWLLTGPFCWTPGTWVIYPIACD